MFEKHRHRIENSGGFSFFMKSQGLSPVLPVTPGKLKAFMESNDLRFQISVFCRKLADEYDWSIVPERYRSPIPLAVEDRWGRVGIEFSGAKWSPAIILGFLYSSADHKVPLTDPAGSLDLFLRIETIPGLNPYPQSVLSALAQKLPTLRAAAGQALIKGEANTRNPSTLLIVQESLTKVIGEATESHVQLDKIYQTWQTWLTILFQDSLLESELLKLKSV